MAVNLYKLVQNHWAVKSDMDVELQVFKSVEEAADHLEHLGMASDEIDLALAEITIHGHTRAHFGVINGSFIFSDNAKPDEAFGLA